MQQTELLAVAARLPPLQAVHTQVPLSWLRLGLAFRLNALWDSTTLCDCWTLLAVNPSDLSSALHTQAQFLMTCVIIHLKVKHVHMGRKAALRQQQQSLQITPLKDNTYHDAGARQPPRDMLEVADGIPAPFPLVTHQPSPTPAARPGQRAPRQHSRATAPPHHTFAACLLTDQGTSSDPGAPQQAVDDVHTGGAQGSNEHASAALDSVEAALPVQAGQLEQMLPGQTQPAAPQYGAQPSHGHSQREPQAETAGEGLRLGHSEGMVGLEQQPAADGLSQGAGVQSASQSPAQLEAVNQTAPDADAMQDAGLPMASLSEPPEPQTAPLGQAGLLLPVACDTPAAPQHGSSLQQQQQHDQAGDEEMELQHDCSDLAAFQQHPEQVAPSGSPSDPQKQQQQQQGKMTHLADRMSHDLLASWSTQPHTHAQHSSSFQAEHADMPAVQLLSQHLFSSTPLAAAPGPPPAAPVLPSPAAPQPQKPAPISSHQHAAIQQVLQALGASQLGPAQPLGHQPVSVSAHVIPSQPKNISQPGQSSPPASAYHAPPLELNAPSSCQQNHRSLSKSPAVQNGEQRLSSLAPPQADDPDAKGHGADEPSSAQRSDEDYEQDEMSQPESSEDEDFKPSEFEQDEMSQPDSSSSEDAFEQDEMSQPDSSSEDEPIPKSMTLSAARLAAATASHRVTTRPCEVTPVSKQQLARLGFPKAAQPAVGSLSIPGRSSPASSNQTVTDCDDAVTLTRRPKHSSKRASLGLGECEPRQAANKRRRSSLASADSSPKAPGDSHRNQLPADLPGQQQPPGSASEQVMKTICGLLHFRFVCGALYSLNSQWQCSVDVYTLCAMGQIAGLHSAVTSCFSCCPGCNHSCTTCNGLTSHIAG